MAPETAINIEKKLKMLDAAGSWKSLSSDIKPMATKKTNAIVMAITAAKWCLLNIFFKKASS